MSEETRKLDLTFIVLAYNEEGALEATVEEIIRFYRRMNISAPVLIMDDGSKDRTPQIADELANKYDEVRVFHHPRNVGIFHNFRKAFEITETTYYTAIPGDNQFDIDSFENFLPWIGKYDVIFGFPNNELARGRLRVILSYLWRINLLILFNIAVTYLAGFVVAPTQVMRKMRVITDGFVGNYESLVRLVLSGVTFIQIPFILRDRTTGETKAVKPMRMIWDTVRMFYVWWKIKPPGFFPPGKEYSSIRQVYQDYLQSRNNSTI